MKKVSVRQIVMTGIMTALAIVVGMFAQFPTGFGHVYLIGIVIFMMPLVLRVDLAFVAAIISVMFADLYSGWIASTWISMVAYGGAVLIISIFKLFKIKLMFMITTVLAAAWVVLSYFMLETVMFSQSVAYADLWGTVLEVGISTLVTWIMYLPMKAIGHLA